MSESLFRRPYFWVRLRANPLGEIIEEYVAHFREQGYRWSTIRDRARCIEHFGCWLRSKGLGVRAVNRDLVHSFLHEHLATCRCPRPCPLVLKQSRAALNHLLRLLQSNGKGAPPEAIHRRPIDTAVEEYRSHLRDVCGLSEATCVSRIRYAREFLEGKFGGRKPKWSALRPGDVVSFVGQYAQRYRPRSLQAVTSSVRCFLRYLQVRGRCGPSLIAAVPRLANWKLSSLPKALTEDQVRDVLSKFDRSTAAGRRDYAMALCQVVLGLRVSEVANLCLEDLDWRSGTLRIENGKGHRSRQLPMPVRVGQAISSYVRHGRLPTRCRNVFVRHRGA